MKVTVKVDDRVCIGSGSCVVVASKNFELNSRGKAEVKSALDNKVKGKELTLDITDAQKEIFLNAARACPVQAISVLDENGKKINY